MSSLTIENLTKVYGETVALDNVGFDSTGGEFVVVLGPSGAGKSTLLRLLNGLEKPTEGSIVLNDKPVEGTRSETAMVFQDHNIIEGMSAYKNALTGALSETGTLDSVLTRYDDEKKRLALEALDTVGLLDEARQRAGSMSGGQKQRVGIARALVQEPEMLLADEPVASLDPKSAQEVMSYMKTAAEERNLTVIVNLHQVKIARQFGERFIGLRGGSLVMDTDETIDMDKIDEVYYGGDSEGEEDGAMDEEKRVVG
jgi:phosphonate transport system ATP-binding protein